VSALCAAGLDPAIGLLHAEQERRPSLALDLMEEFRPLIVDQQGGQPGGASYGPNTAIA
jgi:CRISPR-associated protein Cas1